METALTFNDVTLSPVTHENRLWIRAAELARALGYSRENSVSRLYRNNAVEFTPDMTQVIEISEGTDSALTAKTRIFSPRGCHLIAMFARTAVAKQFRRWVLDVLDKVCQPSGEPQAIPQNTTPSTAESRKPLRALVHAWAQVTGVHHAALWPQVKAHFQLSRIDDLPDEWLPDALAFVQERIDEAAAHQPAALPLSRPLPRPALPQVRVAVPSCNKELRAAADIAEAIRLVENIRERVRREHWPREYRCGNRRDEARYELQWDMFRACNAGLKAAAAALCASVEVSDWA